MKVICEYADECQETCTHAVPHEPVPDCGACGDVADARCVMDTAGLPVYEETGTMAIFIRRREAA